MHFKWQWMIFLSITTIHSSCSRSKMRTLYMGPAQPPPPGEEFDMGHWLKSAMPKSDDRCSGIRQQKAECLNPKPLGLEDGTIPDDRISASSIYNGVAQMYFALYGRLNNASFWSPARNDNSWIEVDLVESTVVSGVITQGSGDVFQCHVTKYKVAYKKPTSSDYDHVIDANGDIKVFDGNLDDATTPITSMFHQSILATVVRIEPVAWVSGVAMRLELLGCRFD